MRLLDSRHATCRAVSILICRLLKLKCQSEAFNDVLPFDIGFHASSIYNSLRRQVGTFLGSFNAFHALRQVIARERISPDYCSSKHRVFPTVPINHVMESTYLGVCENAFYDNEADVLSCTFSNRTLTLQSPYKCAEDININLATVQLEC